MTIASLLDPDEPVVDELPEELVHALTGRPDHRRQVALGVRPVEPDRPVRSPARPAPLASRSRRAAIRPVMSRKWSSSTWSVSRRSSPARAARRASRRGRLGVDQEAEPIARQDQRLGRLERDRGGRAGRAVEEGQLAEEVAGPHRRQDRLVALLGGQHDLHGAGGDDEQRVARVALVEQDLAASEPAGPETGREPLEGGPIETGEQGDPLERLDRLPDPVHGGMVHGAVGGPTCRRSDTFRVGRRLPRRRQSVDTRTVTCQSRAFRPSSPLRPCA